MCAGCSQQITPTVAYCVSLANLCSSIRPRQWEESCASANIQMTTQKYNVEKVWISVRMCQTAVNGWIIKHVLLKQHLNTPAHPEVCFAGRANTLKLFFNFLQDFSHTAFISSADIAKSQWFCRWRPITFPKYVLTHRNVANILSKTNIFG